MKYMWGEPYQTWVAAAPDTIFSAYLAQNTQKTYRVPTGATYMVISSVNPLWVAYLTEGTNLVVNGTFTADTDWTKGGTWTIAAGVATRTALGTGLDLSQTAAGLVQGQAYETKVTTTRSAGSVGLVIGGTAGSTRTSASTFTETVVAGDTTDIIVRADASFAGSVDDISVIPCAAPPTADNILGSGCELINSITQTPPVIRNVSGIARISLFCATAGNTGVSMSFYT